MSLLLLPHVILTRVFVDWLPIKGVGRLDSAICNRNQRDKFLQLVRAEQFVVHQILYVRDMSRYLVWHIKRKIKSAEVALRGGISLPVSCLLFATIVGKHTKRVSLSRSKNALAVLMAGIAGNYRSLESLELVECGDITGIESLFQMTPTLRNIYIYGCNIHSDFGMNEVVLPNVKSLKFVNTHDLGILTSLVRCCTHLVELLFHGAPTADDACLQMASQHAYNLRVLMLWDCPEVTDAVMIDFAQCCPSLRDLKIGNCASLTDETIIAFAKHCPLLESITLMGPFTDASLAAIATHCGTRLRCLSIHSCVLAGDEGLDANLMSFMYCPNLMSFMSSNIPATANAALARLISASQHLEEVALQFSEIDDTLPSAIASRGATLLHLNLMYSTGYTSSGLASVALSCTKLQTIYLADEEGISTEELSEGMRMLWEGMRPELRFDRPNWTKAPYWKW